MVDFLKDANVEEDVIIANRHGLTEADQLALNWPSGHRLDDADLFNELAEPLNATKFWNLDCVQDVFNSGLVTIYNYNWLVIVENGQKKQWYGNVVEFIRDRADR